MRSIYPGYWYPPESSVPPDETDNDDEEGGMEWGNDPSPNPDCPACGGETGYMGMLGNYWHWRCMFCGMEFNREEEKI